VNLRTGVRRVIREIEVASPSESSEEQEAIPQRSARLACLVERLLSPAMQVQLPADIGNAIGLNKEDVRLASLDMHAQQRFPCLGSAEKAEAVARCRHLFDLEAFIKALTVEINALNADSCTESLPRQFVEWASVGLCDPHVIFNEAEGLTLSVGEPLILAIVEKLVLGRCGAPAEEVYCGVRLCDLVTPLQSEMGDHEWEVESSGATELP